MASLLDTYLSAEIRQRIEKRYYARVNAQSRFEVLQRDPTFMAHMERHVGLISDHGVVHVRDVARQLLEVLAQLHGVVIPLRSSPRLEWMKGYGVLVAYLHDIAWYLLNMANQGLLQQEPLLNAGHRSQNIIRDAGKNGDRS